MRTPWRSLALRQLGIGGRSSVPGPPSRDRCGWVTGLRYQWFSGVPQSSGAPHCRKPAGHKMTPLQRYLIQVHRTTDFIDSFALNGSKLELTSILITRGASEQDETSTRGGSRCAWAASLPSRCTACSCTPTVSSSRCSTVCATRCSPRSVPTGARAASTACARSSAAASCRLVRQALLAHLRHALGLVCGAELLPGGLSARECGGRVRAR